MSYALSVVRALHEHAYSSVAEQPYAYVGEVEIVSFQFVQFLNRRLLQHALHVCRCSAVADEYSVVCCHFGIEPQSEAHDVGFGQFGQCLRSAYQHVAADNHGMQRVWCSLHKSFVQRYLQLKKVLREFLSAFPSVDGYRGQYLSRWCVCRQSSALSTRMQQQSAF